MKTVLILPAYNEEGKIGKVVSKSKPYVDRVVVVDDGSNDRTAKEAKNAGAFVIIQPVNMGAGAAIRAGFEYGIANNFDVCVVMGGDDQDNPNEIPLLLEKIRQGYDFVQGSRYVRHEQTENMPLFRRVTTKGYSLFFRLVTGFPVTDGSNGFRAIRTSILKTMRLKQDWLNRYELEPYVFYQAIKKGYRVIEVQVTKRYPKQRKTGFTKMKPFKDWWRITRPLIFLRLGIKK